MTTRRSFLHGGLAACSASALSGLVPGLGLLSAASAQARGDYKALVCLFLDGGMDCHDTIIPVDPSEHAAWSAARAQLLPGYERAGWSARTRSDILPLGGAQPDGRTFGVPQELSPLADLYAAGDLAVVPNVGPLAEYADREGIKSGRQRAAPRLQSHNDHRSLWLNSDIEGARTGWGGRMADAIAPTEAYAAISVDDNPTFLAGLRTKPFQLGSSGISKAYGTDGRVFGSGELNDDLTRHYTRAVPDVGNLFADDFQSAQRFAVEASDELSDLMNATNVGEEVAIGENETAARLAVVAKMISLRAALGVPRQVFFVRAGPFDTHRDQASQLPKMQAEIAVAMRHFHDAMAAQGASRDVTLFTASDFGRTLSPNKTGTDHGWGGHHFVLGGAVDGGRFTGEMAPGGFGHDLDIGRGRLIPTTATDQYVGALGRWFGLADADLREVLPLHGRFDGPIGLF